MPCSTSATYEPGELTPWRNSWTGPHNVHMAQPRAAKGRYSPAMGFTVPSEGFTGTPAIGCPPGLCREAQDWWATQAQSPYAHVFTTIEWQDLADTARVMDRFYATGEPKYIAEVRQHQAQLYGLATRSRLHINIESPVESATEKPVAAKTKTRVDPRLKAV